MITLRKRLVTAGLPAIIAAVALAGSLSAAELLASDSANAEAESAFAVGHAQAASTASAKGDLKVDLADVHGRPTRCVSGFRQTTCTGWPVTGPMLAYKSK
ncbi:hypothetical protein [Roseibium aggregatum]|uniref:Uncharacterized protein n=1 Tax=Roseibium aggregatum TaxID=187304 RepID=A0A939EBD4_9HYPH|nr:hypothetical protein [Roseibium aggregatum]MBN9669424.1 hypothetical protein [Roseibium aggregatum]